MNVAIVCPYDLAVPGGVQDQVLQLAGWMTDLGHDATIIGAGVEGPPGAVLLGRTVSITANKSSTPIALGPNSARRLREAVGDADVVHIHEPFMPVVSTAAVRISDLPTVGTFHADPPRWARVGYRVGSSLFTRLARRLDVVTTISHVSASAIAPFAQARVIPNGVNVAAYGRGAKTRNRVAFLGRDDERKGLQVMLDAWPGIIKEIPDAELRVIGAERPEELDGVSFLGRVSETDKISELASAEVYCAPNLGGESFGIVLAEGMASRCAVVASAIPAFVSVLAGSGDLVAPGDSAAISERIVSLLRDRNRLRRNQEAARNAVERFDGNTVARQYVAAYEDAIAAYLH